MHPPPGTSPTTELRVEHISATGDTAPSTGRKAMRLLTREWAEVFPDAKPLTNPQAHRMLRDYDAARAKAKSERRPELGLREWIERTIGQAPGPGRQRSVLKREWRVAS